MNLIYVDESGNTGTHLQDAQQPIFVLGALVVSEDQWVDLEQELESSLQRLMPDVFAQNLEVHGSELRSGRQEFKRYSVAERLALRDAWLEIAAKFQLKFVYRAINKSRYHAWQSKTFPAGVEINPHVAAFPLVARVVNEYLNSLPGVVRGIFISDENKQIVQDVEKSIRLLRTTDSKLKLSHIIEKGFFIDSRKSRVLQLCDICVLSARKFEEQQAGMKPKSVDVRGVELIQPLIHRGEESLFDVLAWLAENR